MTEAEERRWREADALLTQSRAAAYVQYLGTVAMAEHANLPLPVLQKITDAAEAKYEREIAPFVEAYEKAISQILEWQQIKHLAQQGIIK